MKIIYKDGTVAECPQDQELHVLRHTAAHIMAQAIKRLYPQADFAFGPATENGFYYDVDLGDTKLTDEDLAAIEKEMKKICKENLPIKPFILPRAEAVKLMEDRQEHYKIEHMADLAEETEFSFYQQGEYVDMCIGPHLTYTKALKAFKITQQSGAYWKNDKENKMLTRINGVAFRNQEELDAWEKQQQEARERDHRKIGKEMRLFMTDDLVGRGLPMFLPNGYTVWQELENYIKAKERERGYLHVMTPCIGTVNLYRTSGHWDHYRENMFPAMEMEGEDYVLRPMNCPHHMMIYANQPHSYRQLPIRIGEIAHDFRYESSGTLKGIERGRHFCQNDAHLFCTPEQIKSEVADVCSLIFDVYKDFNITDYRCVLSLRDPADKKKYHDDDAMWNHAENALREVLTELGIHFTEEIGEAAFYGPKLDVNVTCNPNIGGTSKGHLVKEIDALGGEMGKNIDKTFIQSKMLNKSKGPAVHSLRAQADKRAYSQSMREVLENTDHLTIRQMEIAELIVEDGVLTGVKAVSGAIYHCKAAVLCTGVYLNARCIYGDVSTYTGPNGLQAATHLTDSLKANGVEMVRFKTGTPARIDKRSIDFSKMEEQFGDERVVPFSFSTDPESVQIDQESCWLTYTNEETHKIIRENLSRSPLYSGMIEGTGPRYCPSIEDKVVKFADKNRHQVFLEPEGRYTNEMYVGGIRERVYKAG